MFKVSSFCSSCNAFSGEFGIKFQYKIEFELIIKLQRKVRSATRLTVLIVCSYLMANVLNVMITAWEYIDFESAQTEEAFWVRSIKLHFKNFDSIPNVGFFQEKHFLLRLTGVIFQQFQILEFFKVF